MDKVLPDKWVRKAVYEAINNMLVYDSVYQEDINVPCYDYRVPTINNKSHYILMTTQTNSVSKDNKCEYFWEGSILLDIVTSYSSAGNYGSRLLSDDILNNVRDLVKNIELDVNSGLKIITRTFDFPNDLNTITQTESVYRKFMRIELLIN